MLNTTSIFLVIFLWTYEYLQSLLASEFGFIRENKFQLKFNQIWHLLDQHLLTKYLHEIEYITLHIFCTYPTMSINYIIEMLGHY
jgi:hypothetical protein